MLYSFGSYFYSHHISYLSVKTTFFGWKTKLYPFILFITFWQIGFVSLTIDLRPMSFRTIPLTLYLDKSYPIVSTLGYLLNTIGLFEYLNVVSLLFVELRCLSDWGSSFMNLWRLIWFSKKYLKALRNFGCLFKVSWSSNSACSRT